MCDACVMQTCTGSEGPKTGKVKKNIGFESIFEGVQGGQRTPAERTSERAEPLLGHFGATFGSLWVYSGDFGSLYDYFGIIVELLWM